jgi:K+/H+ antiporter YhaU regulatory subunit KhtT
MNISDLWPLLTIIVPIIVLYFGYIQQLRIRVAVLEQANEDMQKTLINMQKRMDNHSKKQDDILEAIASLKVELVRQMAATEKQVNSIKTEQVAIAADLKNITRTLSNINRN